MKARLALNAWGEGVRLFAHSEVNRFTEFAMQGKGQQSRPECFRRNAPAESCISVSGVKDQSWERLERFEKAPLSTGNMQFLRSFTASFMNYGRSEK
jgi:hypothetical protein